MYGNVLKVKYPVMSKLAMENKFTLSFLNIATCEPLRWVILIKTRVLLSFTQVAVAPSGTYSILNTAVLNLIV